MDLGTLLSWEQIYWLKVKNQSALFKTESEMYIYLIGEKGFSIHQIHTALTYYEYASRRFGVKEWDKVDDLFAILNKGRVKGDIDSIMESIGTVLWDMGELFNTNAYFM